MYDSKMCSAALYKNDSNITDNLKKIPCPEKKYKDLNGNFFKKLVNSSWDKRFRLGMFYIGQCEFATQGLVW